jgi:arylsulfatase A-like enzyme
VFVIVLVIGSSECVAQKSSETGDEIKRPNILWILAEDLSPFMGCYDDPINQGHTPAIDKLAAQGVLFKRAFVTAPVCSACRSALITGVMQTTTGTHQHRSSRWTNGQLVPEDVRKGERLKPNDVPLPSYFPDTPAHRKSWTTHYNSARGADARVEAILNELKKDGQLENTIVFFFSDHGSNHSLRHKQFCYEGGVHIPLMIRGNHPALKAGTIRNELVSALDISATTLAMAGAQLPNYWKSLVAVGVALRIVLPI